MFYFIFVILVICLIFMTGRDKREADKFLIASLAFFMLDILALILYVSKDVYYYHVLNHYFSFPEDIWNVFMYSSVPRSLLVRMINLFSILYVYFSVEFSVEFMADTYGKKKKRWRTIFRIIMLGSYFIYDPGINKLIYMVVCDRFLAPAQIESLTDVFTLISHMWFVSLIIISMTRVLYSTLKVSKTYFFKAYAMLECVSFVSVSLAYIYVFWFAPAFLIEVSKLADYVNYKQIPLTQGNLYVYRMFPYYLIVASVIILFVIVNYVRLQHQLSDDRLEISRQINASDTTSKAFCHYIKNELLAIQSEIDMLDVSKDSEIDKTRILSECDYLYQRLDEIHRSTKLNELTLKRTDMKQLMSEIVEHMSGSLSNCTVITEYSEIIPEVMVDATYFEQAIHNILCNSAEAMRSTDKSENKITICMRNIDNSLQLSIADNGKGIAAGNINQIFNPFVTTQSLKKHWGIGLSLTYKIINVHGGTTEVTSEEGIGTVFTITLPSIANIGYSNAETQGTSNKR